MNLPAHQDNGTKALHPGAIFVGDTVETGETARVDTEEQLKTRRIQHDATILFAKTTDKKRALANAKFLSECCFSGVSASDAMSAAEAASQSFDKFWVRQCTPSEQESPAKRRKRQDFPDSNSLFSEPTAEGPGPVDIRAFSRGSVPDVVLAAKNALILGLKRHGDAAQHLQCIETLHQWYSSLAAMSSIEISLSQLDGSWKSLNRPSFSDCLGINERGEYKYTLGRIAFDAFRPTNLVCSIKGVYNSVKPVHEFNLESRRPRSVPHRLLSDTSADEIRIYDTISLIQIEAGQTRSGNPPGNADADDFTIQDPIQARMTNHGFLLPDPEVKHRYSVHFTGGSLRPRDTKDLAQWRELFDPQLAPPYKIKELANMIASNVYLGAATQAMQQDGSLRYSLKRPIGGQGRTFIDVLYSDSDFRVVRGHHGSYFCFSR